MPAINLTPKSTAVLIRTLLKRAFPTTKFSIVTERGSMVSSVRVAWTDGPTVAAVERFTALFACGHFDGMTDGYDYATGADRYRLIDGATYRTGCRYVFTERTISAALATRCIAQIAAYWGGVDVVPVAVAASYGGYQLEPAALACRAVRPDLDGYRHDWQSSIYRAASDRTAFTRREG